MECLKKYETNPFFLSLRSNESNRLDIEEYSDTLKQQWFIDKTCDDSGLILALFNDSDSEVRNATFLRGLIPEVSPKLNPKGIFWLGFTAKNASLAIKKAYW